MADEEPLPPLEIPWRLASTTQPLVAGEPDHLGRRAPPRRDALLGVGQVDAGKPHRLDLLPGGDVDPVSESVLDQLDVMGERSTRETRSRRKSLERAHFGIGALVDTADIGHRGKRGNDRVAPALGACG